jgi:hypothetical protein
VSPKTQRRVFLSLLMVALTLPAEVVLLKALQAPNDKVAADQWAAELDSESLESASKAIQSYSIEYRRAIMGALSPDRRAAVWRDHIDQYVSTHRGLSDEALGALKAAQAALTPTVLGDAGTLAERERLEAAGKQIHAVLSSEDATFITHDLGSRTASTLAGAEPLLNRLASFARNQFAVLARLEWCDCAGDRDCGYYGAYCNTQQGCQMDDDWPMCGYWWSTPCNGLCTAI